MSTRCNIGILENNGTVTYIYCHHGGEPNDVGRLLLKHYNTEEKLRELISLGAISTLGPEIGEKHLLRPGENGNNWGITNAYHRDREEDWETHKPGTYKTENEYWEEKWAKYDYLYLMKKGTWMYSDPDNYPEQEIRQLSDVA